MKSLKLLISCYTSQGKKEINDRHVYLSKKYCYRSISVQGNSMVGFLYKVFTNSVLDGEQLNFI